MLVAGHHLVSPEMAAAQPLRERHWNLFVTCFKGMAMKRVSFHSFCYRFRDIANWLQYRAGRGQKDISKGGQAIERAAN